MQQSMIAAVEWKAPIFYWACCCWLLFIQRLGLCVCMRKYKKSALRLSSWIVAVHALWVIIWQCVCKHVRLKALLAAQHPLCVPYTQLNYRHRNFDFPIFIFVIGLSALRPVVVAKKKCVSAASPHRPLIQRCVYCVRCVFRYWNCTSAIAEFVWVRRRRPPTLLWIWTHNTNSVVGNMNTDC